MMTMGGDTNPKNIRDEVLDLPWIWGMDSLMKIFVDGEYSELFLSAEDGWEPVLK